ncbi:hypothetical protein [Streptomyces sp. NBC_01013]|uniref:hypothetical protein n=1 Tax=Streptomyces sp. NBC_01013 TaxID=2903718 RepID=UPI00386A462F|nr:hypothetical protein OG538_35660 [Streptomyces sp. NBC_01013]
MAPETLADREDELAELAEFSTRPGPGGYLLWSAEAWAGKTALLLSFVCEPPKQTRVVSFFITARLAAHSDREAFLDIVIEQLAEILNEPMPPMSTPANNRPAHFLRMLDAAASASEQQGRRLVLVVDGLDEDLGAAEHSIAALLPSRPVAGMRIILATRPDPPLPDDVPEQHPLRNPEILRALAPSPHARVIRREAERDLKRLLGGNEVEQDLLGLVVASGGGLSGQDLEELTGHQPWRIAESLKTVTGRAFARRSADWSNQAAAQGLYILAHEELQRTAVMFIGETHLAEYRRRLHVWADGYRSEGWPERTPEYLLRGYFRMLQAGTDLQRMIDCALDKPRHDRMLDMSGGDATALDEIANTQSAVVDQSSPNLRAMVLLGARLTDITHRNDGIPPQLPALWARMGRPTRATTLARSISRRQAQLSAWVELLQVLADQGDHDRARAMVAETLPQAVTAAGKDARPVVQRAVEAHAAAGHPGYAEDLAALLAAGESRVLALATVAPAWARAGDTERARSVAVEAAESARRYFESDGSRLPTDRAARERVRARVFAELARMWAGVGDVARARSTAEEVEQSARRSADGEIGPGLRTARALDDARVLGSVARAWAGAGALDRARAAAEEIMEIAQDVAQSGSVQYAIWTMHEALQVWVDTGDMHDAAGLIQILTAQDRRRRPEDSTPGSGYKVAEAAAAWALEGHLVQAEAITRTITAPEPDEQYRARIRAFAAVARGWARSDDLGCAQAVAGEIETLAKAVEWPRDKVSALTTAAHAWFDAGSPHRAEALARTAHALAGTLSDLPKNQFVFHPGASEKDRAEMRARARRLSLGRDRPHAAADVVLRATAPAAARDGTADPAGDIISQIGHPASRTWAVEASRRMAALARNAAADDEQIVRSIIESDSAAWLVEDFIWGATGGDGSVHGAEDFIRLVVGLTLDAWDLVAAVQAAARARDAALCRATAGNAERFARQIPVWHSPAQSASPEAQLWQAASPSDRNRGEALVRSVVSPDDRAWGLAGAVRAFAESGLFSLAQRSVLTDAAFALKVWVMAAAAQAWHKAGATDDAARVAREAEQVARSAATSTTRTLALAIVAKAWGETEVGGRARSLAQEVADLADSTSDPAVRPWARSDASLAWAWAADPDRAESVLQTTDDPVLRSATLLRLAAHSDGPRADALIAQALRLGPRGWPAALHGLITLRPAVLMSATEQLLADLLGQRGSG